jgi:hypothetical protein
MVGGFRSGGLPLALTLIIAVVACGGGGGAEPRSPGSPPGAGDPPADGGAPGDGAPGDGDGGTGTGGEPGAGGDTGGGGETDEGGGEPDAGAGGDKDAGGVAPGTPGTPDEGAAPAAEPGATVFVRRLGGAGEETAVGPLAFGADGGFVALSRIGETENFPPFLGLARLDASGGTLWSKIFDTGGEQLFDERVAISPLGNVFLALSAYYRPIDLGGGPVSGGIVVKFAPDGRFVWQRKFSGISGLAVDGSGSVLVATPFVLVKLRWDGVELWRQPIPEDAHTSAPRVAFDREGNVLVGNQDWNQGVLRKLDPDGNVLWSHALGSEVWIDVVATTAKGTAVVGGLLRGTIRFGGEELVSPDDGDWGGFVVVLEADGRERWGRARPKGPLAVDPAGRLALLEVPRYDRTGCADQLAKWDLTGKELWRRPVSSCDGAPREGAFARGVGVAPSGAIWVQGDANAPFDLGAGVETPRQSDWWLLRVAP